MRAQEDSGIREELNTSGINKKKFYREKEIVAISVAASMIMVGWVSQRKECLRVCKCCW
jgi:hypothetical protein